MKKRKTGLEIFSLSFLDIISCGFGAIVLLILISRPSNDVSASLQSTQDLAIVKDLERQKQNIEDEIKQFEADLAFLQQQTSQKSRQSDAQEIRIDDLNKQLKTFEQTLKEIEEDKKKIEQQQQKLAQMIVESISAKSDKTAQQKNVNRPQDKRDLEVGGIPVDSQYIIFIIDTSSSMDRFKPRLLNIMDDILTIHPKVKGFQIINDNGRYLIPNSAGQWILDSPGKRKNAIRFFSKWIATSSSSPVEGLEVALKNYATKTSDLSIYIFGDDFSQIVSYHQVINALSSLNQNAITQNPKARIHAVGFGVSERYAILMRYITHQNNGTFLALGP
ncbi:MAG: hypothetical protein AAF403_05145 [Pseudomonadota bacterium]